MNRFDIMVAQLYNRSDVEFNKPNTDWITAMAVNHHHVAGVTVHKMPITREDSEV